MGKGQVDRGWRSRGAAGWVVAATVAVSMTIAWSGVADAVAPKTTRVVRALGGAEPDGRSDKPALSADGRYVAFWSAASNLVPGDTNGVFDLFLLDRTRGRTARIDLGPGRSQTVIDPGTRYPAAIAADGLKVAFSHADGTLVAADTNGVPDVFVRLLPRHGGQRTVLASVGVGGVPADDASWGPSISTNGRYLVFSSDATNLVAGDTNGRTDVFVRDLVRKTTRRVSITTGGDEADDDSQDGSISPDGRYIAFSSRAALVPEDTNALKDIYLHDRIGHTTVLITTGAGGHGADGASIQPFLSGDGRYVVFLSNATDLGPGDTNGLTDVYRYDRTNDRAILVSTTGSGSGNAAAVWPRVSASGRLVSFSSAASDLVPDDMNGVPDVFVRDVRERTTTLVSVATDGPANGPSEIAAISGDGRSVAFGSEATDLTAGDTNAVGDVFLRVPLR